MILKVAFQKQKANAKYRGIAFELTFETWLRIWEESGHSRERGRCKGQYVMARHGDEGPYAVSNVSIVLGTLNSAEGNSGPSPLRGRKVSESHRKNIIKSLVGRKLSAETRAKIGAANTKALTGSTWSEKRRAAIMPPVSKETRAKLSVANKGNPWSFARRAAFENSKERRA